MEQLKPDTWYHTKTVLRARMSGAKYAWVDSVRWNMELWEHKQKLVAKMRELYGHKVQFEFTHQEEVELGEQPDGTWGPVRRTVY